jgi:hypothetical protein
MIDSALMRKLDQVAHKYSRHGSTSLLRAAWRTNAAVDVTPSLCIADAPCDSIGTKIPDAGRFEGDETRKALRENTDNRNDYFIVIGLPAEDGVGAAGEIENVAHTFQPDGRCSAPNSL